MIYILGHDIFINELMAHLPLMENTHLVMLMRNFIEPYILNTLPMYYEKLSNFLAVFMTSTLERLAICYDKHNTVSTNPSHNPNHYSGIDNIQYRFCMHVYKECSMPKEGYQVLEDILYMYKR